jgi:signal transduction histidine kinase
MMRHDIRNDLQILDAYSELISEKLTEAELGDLTAELLEEYVRPIEESTNSAIKITETAREVTEVMIQSSTDLKPVRLKQTLTIELENFKSAYPNSEIQLESEITEAGTVLADDMIGSVFRNLLTNAVEHNTSETPQVRVSMSKKNGSIIVTISDNGPGISEDMKNKIFTEGKKGLESEGTGMGLYLVEKLVERYGGSVRVSDSDLGGAEFIVKLEQH